MGAGEGGTSMYARSGRQHETNALSKGGTTSWARSGRQHETNALSKGVTTSWARNGHLHETHRPSRCGTTSCASSRRQHNTCLLTAAFLMCGSVYTDCRRFRLVSPSSSAVAMYAKPSSLEDVNKSTSDGNCCPRSTCSCMVVGKGQRRLPETLGRPKTRGGRHRAKDETDHIAGTQILAERVVQFAFPNNSELGFVGFPIGLVPFLQGSDRGRWARRGPKQGWKGAGRSR